MKTSGRSMEDRHPIWAGGHGTADSGFDEGSRQRRPQTISIEDAITSDNNLFATSGTLTRAAGRARPAGGLSRRAVADRLADVV